MVFISQVVNTVKFEDEWSIIIYLFCVKLVILFKKAFSKSVAIYNMNFEPLVTLFDLDSLCPPFKFDRAMHPLIMVQFI